MPKLAANLSLLFTEFEFLDRFEQAAQAGFRAVEYMFPYSYPKEQLTERLERYRLVQALHNLPAGNWQAGDRGIACQPERVGEFQDGVGRAIEYARTLHCKQVNCLAGIPEAGADPDQTRETLAANLRFAADKLQQAGIRLLIEAVNTRDVPGFYLCHSRQALAIIDEVGSTNLALQYDIYHMQVMEGNLASTIERHFDRIGHFQLADHPGRHEPGTGEIDYPLLFQLIDRLGYTGWIGCEYQPKTTTGAGLGWAKPYLSR